MALPHFQLQELFLIRGKWFFFCREEKVYHAQSRRRPEPLKSFFSCYRSDNPYPPDSDGIFFYDAVPEQYVPSPRPRGEVSCGSRNSVGVPLQQGAVVQSDADRM